MATQIINLAKLSKDLRRVNKTLARIEDIATTRTINIVAGRAKNMIADDVHKDTGISKGTAKRRIGIRKARKGNPTAALLISATRVTYPSPARLGPKGKRGTGISFIGSGKQRRKVTNRVKGVGGLGSKPFIIKGQHSGKKLPVYVLGPFVGNKKASDRKVTAMYYSSLAHLARKDWQKKVDDFAIKEMKKEYPKQLKKAAFTGRF